MLKNIQQTKGKKMVKKESLEQPAKIDKIIKGSEDKVDIKDMPLETLTDYVRYNREARKLNHKLGVCRYPIKQCPVELHPKEKVVFSRNDQPTNPLKVFKSDDMIHFDETLIPGKEYELPVYIVNYLSKKGVPVWKWYEKPDGSKETGISHKDPRFGLRTVYS